MTFRFSSTDDLLLLIKERGNTLEQFTIEREAFLQGSSAENIYREIESRIKIMRYSLKKGVETAQKSFSGLTRGSAYALNKLSHTPIDDPFFLKAVQYSLAIAEINACRGKIVSFPTAGSCGIIPGVLLAYFDTHQTDDRVLRRGFIIASLVGVIISQRVPMAGAEAGCQSECGAAAAMAAAGLTSMIEESPDMIFHSAALALKNSLGLVCDPVAGLVEVPCIKRNSFQAVQAITASHLALNGIQSFIPFDEVISAMKNIGSQLPTTLKESSQGGLARTPTALKCREKIL